MKLSRFYFSEKVTKKKLDKMVKSLYAALNKAIQVAIPTVVIKNGGKSFKWYTEEHAVMSKNVNKLYIRAMKGRKADDLLAYKKLIRSI